MQINDNQAGRHYDLNEIKAIPILDVCQLLGIQWEIRGGKHWCRIRDERTASVLLHPEKTPNCYIDFGGTNKLSDVIQLVCDYNGMSRGDAIKYLAEAFNISPDKQNAASNELNSWEYEKIGLYGDLATKNFTFDIERQGIEKVAQLSQKYGIPMNELRKKHKKIYEQLLYDKALPHLLELRNNYYLNLINTYHMAHTADLRTLPSIYADLEASIKELRTAERLFKKAAEQTAIKAHDPREYEPNADLSKILTGELNPSFGSHDFDSLQSAAKAAGCNIGKRTVPCSSFTLKAFEKDDPGEYYPFTAKYQGDQILIRYLECDYAALKPHLEKMSGRNSLSEKIDDAEKKRQCNSASTDKQVQHMAER